MNSMKDAKWILDVQVRTGRTQSGRSIGKRLKEAILSAYLQDGEFTECRNCKLVLDDPMFANGCPNCGCKDKDRFGAKKKIRKEK